MNLQLKQLLKNQENLSNEKDKEKIIVKQLKNKSTKEAAFALWLICISTSLLAGTPKRSCTRRCRRYSPKCFYQNMAKC